MVTRGTIYVALYLDSYMHYHILNPHFLTGTVDEMIYSLQERKEKMNEAIMDEKGITKQAGGGEDMKEIMKSVVGNFLKSPKGKVTKGKPVDQDVEKSEIISIDD